MAPKKSTTLPKSGSRTEAIIKTDDSPSHPRINFIKSIKFAGLGLDRCDARIDRPMLANAAQNELFIRNEVTLKQYVLTHEEKYFVVGADFELVQRADGLDGKILSIAATFSAKFDLETEADEELVRAFANVEARLVFFPYLRHFASDISYRMSIDPIVLPLTSELPD